MADRKTRRPKRGSPRVAAWVHEVINPLLEALPVEISFFESGNTTWRYYSGRPEYLRPIEGYLTPQARFILDDFRRADADARKRFAKHDELFEHLVAGATDAHATLMTREAFVSRARQKLADYPRAPSSDYPGGAVPEADFPKLVAERIVNDIKALFSHYSDAKFWERYGSDFLEFSSGPEFERLRAARHALLKHDRMLCEWLGKKGFRLCEEYDVPAAPCSGWSPAVKRIV